jgi:hypothetical protein
LRIAQQGQYQDLCFVLDQLSNICEQIFMMVFK